MKLSIITVAFNQKEILQKQYESLIPQKQYIHEWIVYDNGSTDGTWEYLRSLDAFPVRGISKLHNDRLSQFFNFSVALATGDTMLIVAGDMTFLPDTLENLHKDYVLGSMGTGSRINVDAQGEVVSYDWRNPVNHSNTIFISKDHKLWWTFLTGAPLVFSKKDFQSVGGYDEEYNGYGAEDYDLIFGFGIADIPLYQYNAVKVNHFDHPSHPTDKENTKRFNAKVMKYYGDQYLTDIPVNGEGIGIV